jgi:hypothetical protein
MPSTTVRRVRRVLILGGLAALAGVASLAGLGRVRDQDVTIYSVTPDGRAQVIGLRHRTYLLDYGGSGDLVLFRTTFGTGVLTHGREEDLSGGADGPRQTEVGCGAVAKPGGLPEPRSGDW